MINRSNEKRNAKIASDRGFNCHLVYCNEKTGVKLSSYIGECRDADSTHGSAGGKYGVGSRYTGTAAPGRILSGKTGLTFLMRRFGMRSCWTIPDGCIPVFRALKRKVYAMLQPRLQELGWELRPCHNDLVAANLVKNSVTGRCT